MWHDLVRAWWFWAWISIGALLGLLVYAAIVTHYMRAAAFALGYDVKMETLNGWQKFLLIINHWRVTILASAALLSQVFYYVNATDLSTWAALPWAVLFNQRVAAIITIACTLAIPLSHVTQYAKAAETTPMNK